VDFGVVFVSECFLAEIRDFFLDVQAGNREIFQIAGQFKYFLAHGSADFKRFCIRIFVKLAEIKRALALLGDFNFGEFGRAALEYTAIGNRRGSGRSIGGGKGKKSEEKNTNRSELEP
jgi:hypothetical protein